MYQYLFTLLASEKGEVLIWGCNKHGQCALDPAKSSQVNVPTVVDQTVFEGQMVTRIRSGWTHLLAQTGKTVNWDFILRLWFSQIYIEDKHCKISNSFRRHRKKNTIKKCIKDINFAHSTCPAFEITCQVHVDRTSQVSVP